MENQKKQNYKSFKFYGAWEGKLKELEKEFGAKYAYEALWNLMLVATGNEPETKDETILDFINGRIGRNV